MRSVRDRVGTFLVRACAAALFVCSTHVLAQSGALRVHVLDPAGEPLPGAVVTLTSRSQLVARTAATTDASGVASFPVLRAGPGYSVEVTFPGYAPRTVSDLRIRMGDDAVVPVRLTTAIEEQIEVRAEREVVDLDKASTSSKFSDEFIRDLPVQGRFYQNLLALAPGVLDSDGDGNPNVNGARSRDFKTLVSGISNVDPLTGEWLSEVNPDSIEEIEIVTAGAGVELGRAQGGFARIIQKQGSNDFEGLAGMIYGSSRLDGRGATGLPAEQIPSFEWVQPSIQVSGPILKDRLWYRLSYESIRREDPVNAGGRVALTTREQTLESYQITWQASPRNKLALQYERDPKALGNVGINARVPPEAAKRQEYGGPTFSLAWTAAQSPRLLVESQVAYQNDRVNVLPTVTGVPGGCLVNPFYPILDLAPCFYSNANTLTGSYYIQSRDRRQRLTVRSQVDLFAGKFLGATHRLKFGTSVENERYFRTLKQTSDLTFVTNSFPAGTGTASYRIPFPVTTTARVTGANWGLFLEDQMRLPGSVTVSAGVRVDGEATDSLGYSPFDPEGEAREFDRRFAAGENQAELIRTQFTAYQDITSLVVYLTQALGVDPSVPVFNGPTSASTQWTTRRRPDDVRLRNTNFAPRVSVTWDPANDGKTKLFASLGRYYDKIFLGVPLIELEPSTTTFTFGAERRGPNWFAAQNRLGTTISTRIVDRKLRTPFQDELSAGVEREIAPETAIKLTWIDRRFRDQLQDIDLNHAPHDYGHCITRYPFVEVRDGPDGILDDCWNGPDGITDLFVQNPGWGDVLLVGNFNNAHYRGAILELVRRFYRGWQLEMSYTWSEAIGDAEDFNQLLGNDRTTSEDEKGYLAYDQRHVFKLNATTILRGGMRLGATVQYESGLPYSILETARLPDAIPPTYFGSPEQRLRLVYPTGRRNDQRNPPFWTFNVRVAKEMMIASRVNVSLTAEVFNLMNDDRLRIFDVTDGRTNAERRFGRRWQMGARFAF